MQKFQPGLIFWFWIELILTDADARLVHNIYGSFLFSILFFGFSWIELTLTDLDTKLERNFF